MHRSRFFFLFWLIAITCSGQAAPPRLESVTFGGDPAYPPFEWLEKGRPTGLHIDVQQAMGRASGTKVRHALRPWPETVEALRTGSVDVVPMFRSEERERHFWFSDPIHFAHHAIYTIDDPGEVSTIPQLRDWRVAVEKSSFAHDQFESGDNGPQLILEGTTRDALIALAEDRADYAVLAAGVSDRLATELGIAVRQVGMPIWPREYAFAVRLDRPELVGWVNSNLTRIAADGTFEAIQAKWSPSLRPGPMEERRGFRFAWMAFLALLLAGGVIMRFAIRRSRAAIDAERQMRSTAERSAAYLTSYDPLTGLSNLDHFLNTMSAPVANASETLPMEVIVLKVTNLEEIAKIAGREHATNLLRQIAARLSQHDCGAGVLTKGTFGLAVPVHDVQQLSRWLSDVGGNVSGIAVEVAWGAARAPYHGRDVGDLLHKAEVALAASIGRRRTWLVYDPSLEPDRADLQLVRDFEAFGADEIFPVYQPQLDISSGRITCAEVLARWNHRDRGLISPTDFIPLLERAGLVSKVTQQVLESAVGQSVHFRKCGLRCRFSLNISVTDIRESDVPAMVADALERHGGDPADIIIELTESGAVEQPDRVRSVLQRLKNMGVGVAIDDFGTGFSSLANLVDLPFDELKVDQLFVKKMLASAGHKSVVQSAVALGREMGLIIVAEGAEDQATIAALVAKGCDRVQGYAVAKPMSADELVTFASRYRWEARDSHRSGERLKLIG